MCRNVFLMCLVFTGIGQTVVAQRFGGNAPSVHFRQLNTPAARVIFPTGTDSTAERVANIALHLSGETAYSIGSRFKKINIVLHPRTTVSNGYVALGPFRSEFYLTPPQNSFELGSLPWPDMLAIHEYRHVQQYNNFNTGLSHAFRVVFGENGQELANALAIPNWFWEGDAVYQETLVSAQGRGRLPYFFNDYRSLWLAGRRYNYMKLRNGSLRDFTPDHYRLGYMLVAYGREKFGNDFWKNVTHDAAGFRPLIYPFQHAVKRYAGISFPAFTRQATGYFRDQPGEAHTAVTLPRHFEADQEYPAYADSGIVVYLKSSYHEPPYFVIRQDGREEKIRTRDVAIDNQFSVAAGKITYAAYRPATRWAWNDFNEINVLDIATGKEQTITHRTKYFSPSFSPDGGTIVAVSAVPGKACALHLLEANGRVIRVLPNPDTLFYTYPVFSATGNIVAAARTTAGKMALVEVDSSTGKTTYLTPPGFHVMGNPRPVGERIYFTAAFNGYDRLMAVVPATAELLWLPLAPAGIGVYQPAIRGNQLLFSSFTATGFRLQDTTLSQLAAQPVTVSAWETPPGSFGVHFTGPAAGILAGITQQHFPPSGYSPATGLFNFHSLLPYVNDPDYQLSLVGNNVLNTMSSEIFGGYNRNEGYKQVGAKFTYGGFFPYINIGGNYIFNRRDYIRMNQPVNWNESQVNAGLEIPLNLSRGRRLTNLYLGSDYVYKTVRYTGVYKDSIASTQLGYLNNYFFFSSQLQQGRQQIYPALAQVISVGYRTALEQFTARQFLAYGVFYLPGAWFSHSIGVNLAYQNRDTLNHYRYSNSFPFSRGYQSPNLREMARWGINYHFPLAYPDFGVGNIVYFQRVRANAFYDDTRGIVAYTNGTRMRTPFRSTGAELFFDTKWWNELPLSFGFRFSHLLDPDLFGGTGSSRFEFILPVNLFQR